MGTSTMWVLLITGLSLGMCAGFVMHPADFCLAGTFRDIFLFGSYFKLRMLLLLVTGSAILFEITRQLGVLPLYPFPLLGPASLVTPVGGFFFGIGMVLAGGCVVGTLYKLGSGSTLSGFTLLGLLAGSAFYAEIHPWVSAASRSTVLFQGRVTFPQLLGIDPLPPVALVALPSLAVLLRWHRQGRWERASGAAGDLQPWRAALILSLVSLSSSLVVGMPIGITTAYAKIGGFIESLLLSKHVQGLAYFQSLPLHYPLPITGALLSGGPGPTLDAIAAIQFPVIAGIVLGGALSAALLKELRFQTRLPWRQQLSAVLGGVIMGLAARAVPGCNVWHLMGGLPILALQSLLFLAGLLPGAWLGTRLLCRFVIV